MTLIATQIADDRLEVVADGLSCHDKLTIIRSRQIGAEVVQTDVPGRTTLQKIFPHPDDAFAIVHCGSNHYNGKPIRTTVEQFWDRAVSEKCLPDSLVRLFDKQFGSRGTAETVWLLGWEAPTNAILHVIGSDWEDLGGGRYWGGSGRHSLPRDWSELDSLREMGERFLDECQKQAPFNLPFFANCYGGHWHRLQLMPGKPPQWVTEPCVTGVEVSALLPGLPQQVSCDKPVRHILSQGEGFKKFLRRKFNVRTVRGVLERTSDENLRESMARLIAIFDEVQLDSSVETAEDARRYAGAVERTVTRLSTMQ